MISHAFKRLEKRKNRERSGRTMLFFISVFFCMSLVGASPVIRWVESVVDTNETSRVDALYENVTLFLNNTQLSEAEVDGFCSNNEYASYEFGANNFNGSGDFTTTGNVTVGELEVDTNTLVVDSANNSVGIGVIDPDTKLEIWTSGTQLKLSYDDSNYATFATQSDGDLVITPSGGNVNIDTTLTLASGSITDSTGTISFGDENLTTTGDGSFGDTYVNGVLNLVDGAESSTIQQNGNWLEIGKGTGFGTTMGGHTLIGDDAVYRKVGLNTPTIALTAHTPTIFQSVQRDSTSGFAFDMFNLHAKSSTTGLDSDVGKIGFLGNFGDTGIDPYPTYIFMGATPTSDYDNAVLKIDAEDRVGIGLAGTDRPTVMLDVNGAISSGQTTIDHNNDGDVVNVSAVNSLKLDCSGGDVIIGGFVGGVAGQVLHLFRGCVFANDVTLEHNEGTTNQNIFLHAGVDETLFGEYGGWTLICDGEDWYDPSHSKHV